MYTVDCHASPPQAPQSASSSKVLPETRPQETPCARAKSSQSGSNTKRKPVATYTTLSSVRTPIALTPQRALRLQLKQSLLCFASIVELLSFWEETLIGSLRRKWRLLSLRFRRTCPRQRRCARQQSQYNVLRHRPFRRCQPRLAARRGPNRGGLEYAASTRRHSHYTNKCSFLALPRGGALAVTYRCRWDELLFWHCFLLCLRRWPCERASTTAGAPKRVAAVSSTASGPPTQYRIVPALQKTRESKKCLFGVDI